jgi:hypothetical protein
MPLCARGNVVGCLGRRTSPVVESRRTAQTGLEDIFLRFRRSKRAKEHHVGLQEQGIIRPNRRGSACVPLFGKAEALAKAEMDPRHTVTSHDICQ